MEYVRREMSEKSIEEDISFHVEPDTASIYEALAHAQDFTQWDEVNGFTRQALKLIVV